MFGKRWPMVVCSCWSNIFKKALDQRNFSHQPYLRPMLEVLRWPNVMLLVGPTLENQRQPLTNRPTINQCWANTYMLSGDGSSSHYCINCRILLYIGILSSKSDVTPSIIDTTWWHSNLICSTAKSYAKFQLNMPKHVEEKWIEYWRRKG